MELSVNNKIGKIRRCEFNTSMAVKNVTKYSRMDQAKLAEHKL